MTELDQEKLFYERFWTLHGDRDLVRVYERFGPLAFRRSSVLEGFEKFINDHGFRGDTVVEIGTLKGLTAIVLARHFKRVITIDIVEDQQSAEISQFLGVGNIEFHAVRDNAEKYDLIAGLGFDAAYVDGNHKDDTLTDFQSVHRCGCVMLHEHWNPQPAVVKLVAGLSNIVTEGKFALWRLNG